MSYTKHLMAASAVALGAMGLAVSFAPQEFLAALGAPADRSVAVLLKLMGGLYLGFALMNWTARNNMIGGIYARPVSVGNLLHFLMGAITLVKYQVTAEFSATLAGALGVYLVFGAAFGWLVFGRGAACAVAGNE